MFILEDEKRNKACKDLEKKFADRFPSLLLIWDGVNRNTITEWQKFTLKEVISGQKLRLIFVTNDAFENDEIRSFLIQFEDHIEEFSNKSPEALRFRMGRFKK